MTRALEHYDVETERPPGERWISMSNALTRASHGLTLPEKRLIMCAVAKLDSRRMARIAETGSRVTAAEYAEVAECNLKTAYEALQAAADSLLTRIITFYEPASKRKGKEVPSTKVRMHWVTVAKYQKGEGWVKLYWCYYLLPHLIGLKKQFTSYQLQQAGALRSIHSWRLLELLTAFESTGWAQYDIEEFATAMDATVKQRNDFAAIRRRIIEPAVKELTQKDNWIITWQPIKAGRRVKAVRFDFRRDDQLRLPLEEQPPPKHQAPQQGDFGAIASRIPKSISVEITEQAPNPVAVPLCVEQGRELKVRYRKKRPEDPKRLGEQEVIIGGEVVATCWRNTTGQWLAATVHFAAHALKTYQTRYAAVASLMRQEVIPQAEL